MYLDDEERVLFDRLEKLAQNEMDKIHEILIRLFTRKRLFLPKDILEQQKGRYLQVHGEMCCISIKRSTGSVVCLL